MKKGILSILLLSIFFGLNAKNEYSYIKLFNSNQKSNNQTLISFKFVSKNPKTQDFTYTLRLPISETSIAFLTNHSTKSRFVNSKIQYSARSLNLNSQEIKTILDKNKLYNFTRENFKIGAF